MNLRNWVVVVLAVSACEAPPQATQPGIYGYSTQRVVDTCSPLRAEGTGLTSVSLQGDLISVMMPSGSAGEWGFLQRFEIPLGGLHEKIALQPSSCGSGTMARDVDVVAYGNPLTLSVTRVFTEVQPGAEPCVSEFPSADCHAEQQLTYSLVEACPETCAVIQDRPSGPMRCDCPDAGR